MSITRKLMDHFNILVDKESDAVIELMDEILLEFLSLTQVWIWNGCLTKRGKKSQNNSSQWLGSDLRLFTDNFKEIVKRIRDSGLIDLDTSQEWAAMLNSLELWPDIQTFLFKAKVNSDYLEEVDKFERDVANFYEYGAKTFLSNRKGDEGGKESVYLHLLRFNIAQHARITYDRHKVGIGIFNLQAYERQNRHSKNQFVKHCNMKGNVCVQVMTQLHWRYDILDIPNENKRKRKKQQQGPLKFRRIRPDLPPTTPTILNPPPSSTEMLDETVFSCSI